MGNYISNNCKKVLNTSEYDILAFRDSTKKNALILIADYMTKDVYIKFDNESDRLFAIDICKSAFKRVYRCACAPIYTLEVMYDEHEAYIEKCGKTSRYVYEIGTDVINDILDKMS